MQVGTTQLNSKGKIGQNSPFIFITHCSLLYFNWMQVVIVPGSMQPVEAQTGLAFTPSVGHNAYSLFSNYVLLMHSLFVGVSTKSHLYNSLKVYLNNRNRLQPIIGLQWQIPVLGICCQCCVYMSRVYWNDLSFYVHSGLGSIIECVKAGTHSVEALYLCEVCGSRLGKADIRNHIMGSLHRYNYIVSRIVEEDVMASLSAA